MHHDHHDDPKGRVLSRREVLTLLGGVSAAVLLGKTQYGFSAPAKPGSVTNTAAPAATNKGCIARPELTEGPYFVEEGILRSDIRSDPKTGLIKAGVPLEIAFSVSKLSDACEAIAGAVVDVWHCDALGAYSDVAQNGTVGQKFLRGSQITDQWGKAKFMTIFPGWYQGRAVHIHFKIRLPVEGKQNTWSYEFTSQFFFEDALSKEIYAKEPYVQNGPPGILNARDGIFNQCGQELLLDLKKSGTGYRTSFDIALDLSRPSRSAGGRRPGGPGGGPPGFGGPGGPGFGGGPGWGPPPDPPPGGQWDW